MDGHFSKNGSSKKVKARKLQKWAGPKITLYGTHIGQTTPLRVFNWSKESCGGKYIGAQEWKY